MIHHLLSNVLALPDKSVGSEVAQRLMWANGIMDMFPRTQGFVEVDQVEAAVREFAEFLGMCSLRPFHVAIQFRRGWRQHEETYASLLHSVSNAS